MMYAWHYMQQLNYAIKDNEQLRGQNNYLRDKNAILEAENNVYRTIQTCVLNGDLEEKIQVVKCIMEIGIDKLEGIYSE